MALPLAELVDPTKAAIIVVDVQNDFCHPDGAIGKTGAPTDASMAMLPRLTAFLDEAREAGTRIIFIQTIHESETDSAAWKARRALQDLCRKGTWGADFIAVSPQPGEPVVIKHRYSAFVNTRLDSILRTFGTETLIMTGVATNVCVESTARLGFMLDYHIVMLSDCTAAASPAEHEGGLKNIARSFGVVATADDVAGVWKADVRVPATGLMLARRSVLTGAAALGLAPSLGTRAGAQTLREIVIAEPVHSTGYAPLYLGIERGFFSKRGLDVKMLTATGGAHVSALVSGQVWGNIGGPESDAMANGGKSDPLLSICNVVNRANVYIIAKKGTGPKSKSPSDIADFMRGKKIALNRYGGTPDVLGRWYIQKIGLQLTDMTLINNGDTTATLPMVKSGVADIALVIEPLITLGKEQGVWDEPFFAFPSLGDYSYSVISVRKSSILNDRPAVQGFVDALIDALKLTASDHASIVENSHKEFPTMADSGIKGTIDRSYADKLWSLDGVISPAGYALDMEVVNKSGVFTKSVPFAEVVDMQFVTHKRA